MKIDTTKLQKYYDRITWSLKNEWPEIEKDEKYFKDFYDWYSFWMQDDMELIAEVAKDFNLECKIDCKSLICEIIKRHEELNKSVQ